MKDSTAVSNEYHGKLKNEDKTIGQTSTPWGIRHILKTIKSETGTSVIFPINISLIHFVFVFTGVPNVGERFTKT